MNLLQILLDKTVNHYNVHEICKLWSNRYRLGIEETEAFAHELSRHAFTKEDIEELFMYQAEHKMNHNRHFSYWTKESDPDYSIAESLYQKLKNKEYFTRYE